MNLYGDPKFLLVSLSISAKALSSMGLGNEGSTIDHIHHSVSMSREIVLDSNSLGLEIWTTPTM